MKSYPIFSGESAIPSWQTEPMPDSPFDPDLVRQKMKELGVTQTLLASDVGLTSQSAVANILSGKRQVRAYEASAIYKRLGIETQPLVRVVPVIGLASAGNWREAILHSGGVMPVPRDVVGDRAFAVEIKGDSMDEIIQDGETVVVDPDQTQLYNDKVYLIENGEHEAQVKLYRANPARFEPASSNKTYPTFFMGTDPIRVIGRVCWRGGAL